MSEDKPSQYAREAAGDIMVELFQHSQGLEAEAAWAETVRRGEDDAYPIVQAFAQFERQCYERAAKVAEENRIGWINGEAKTPYGRGYQNACLNIAQAIRSLGGK